MKTDGLIKAFIAATVIPRYAVVRVTGENEVSVATDVDQALIGVSAEPAETPAGSRVDVLHSGIAEVKASAAINAGAWVTAAAAGAVVTAAATDEYIGRALTAANAAGDVLSIEIIKG